MDEPTETDKLISAPDIEKGNIPTNNVSAKKECQICGQFIYENTMSCLTSCFNCVSQCFVEFGFPTQEKVNCKIIIPTIITLFVIYYVAITNAHEIGKWVFENDFDERNFQIYKTTTNGYPPNYNAIYDSCYNVNTTVSCIKYEPVSYKINGYRTIFLSTIITIVFFMWIALLTNIVNHDWKQPFYTVATILFITEFCTVITECYIIIYFDLAEYNEFKFYNKPIPPYFADKMIKCNNLAEYSMTCYAHPSMFSIFYDCIATFPIVPLGIALIFALCMGLHYCIKSMVESYNNYRNQIIQ
jgi:hypothetical protein